MKDIFLKVPEKEYRFFMKLIQSLGFVKIEKVGEEDSKEEVIKNLKKGFEEMKLIKKDKLKTTSAKDFLNEL